MCEIAKQYVNFRSSPGAIFCAIAITRSVPWDLAGPPAKTGSVIGNSKYL